MENKLGRKSMQDWQAMTDALTARVYKSGFNAGYDAAKDETPDVDTMAQILIERYKDDGLSDLMMAIDRHCPHVPSKPDFKTVKRVAKVGERILITNAGISGRHYKNGDILKVRGIDYDDDILVEGFNLQIEHNEYEVIIENEGVISVKSLNQQRAELIQRAREFVEEQKTSFGGLTRRYGYDAPSDPWSVTDAEFIVNKEKNTVVCLLKKQMNKDVVDKAIAKCHPDEIFNEHIGKAIVLCKALEIDIPDEFMHAVQPDEIVSGMIIDSSGVLFAATEHTGRCSFASVATITDDTNAKH